MKVHHQISDDEVVAAFTVAEVDSSRFRNRFERFMEKDDIRWQWLSHPDLLDKEQNEFRKEALGKTRGWPNQEPLFNDMPLDIVWHKAVAVKEDFLPDKIRYITNEEGWMQRAPHRSPMQFVESAQEDDPVIELARMIMPRLENVEPLIIIATPDLSQMTLLEGHGRATAFCLSDRKAIDVIIGLTPQASNWYYF